MRHLTRLLFAGLLLVGCAHIASATAIELLLTDEVGNSALINSAGTLILTGAASGTATVNLATNNYTFDGSVGAYTVLITGEGSPGLTPGSLYLFAPLVSSSSTTGLLRIAVSEDGISTSFPGWNMGFSAAFTSNPETIGSVTNIAFADNSNAFFGMGNPIGAIGPFGPTGGGTIIASKTSGSVGVPCIH